MRQTAWPWRGAGVAVPTRLCQGDTWHADVCRIDVVAFGPQAETVGASLCQGRGVLIEGRLEWRRWEQEGQSRFTREVIIERLQVLSRLRAHVPEETGGGSSRRGLSPVGGPLAAETAPW
jgi:single-strand DNA-binding protein